MSTVATKRRPRRSIRPAGDGSSVVLAVRRAPTLDPPFDDTVLTPTGMDLLPIDWSPADRERRQYGPGRRRAPAVAETVTDGVATPPSATPALSAAGTRVAVVAVTAAGSPRTGGPAEAQRTSASSGPPRSSTAGAPSLARVASPAPIGPGAVPARAAMQRYVAMCVEVLNGYRPSAHLRPITDHQRYGDIADQLVRRAVRVRISPGQAARQGKLVRVRRMLLNEPTDGVAEAAVVLEQGGMCWAMAVRLERGTRADRSGPWRCTVVQVI